MDMVPNLFVQNEMKIVEKARSHPIKHFISMSVFPMAKLKNSKKKTRGLSLRTFFYFVCLPLGGESLWLDHLSGVGDYTCLDMDPCF